MRRLNICAMTACLLSACAEVPVGPTVSAMPGPYKPFEVFQSDDAVCRQYAQAQIGQSPSEAAASSIAAGAVTGTAVGAAAGALVGRGEGAAAGGGVGLLAGTAIGAESGNRSAGYLQYRYNVAYEQCMYAKGNQVPGFAIGATAPPPPPPPAPVPPPAH